MWYHFYDISRTGKTNPQWKTRTVGLPVGLRLEWSVTGKGLENLGVVVMLCVLIGVIDIYFCENSGIVQLKLEHFILCKFYIWNKEVLNCKYLGEVN